MRDKARNIKPDRPGNGARKSGTAGRNAPRGISPQHTDAQREQIQTGLLFLARMIARAHLQRQAAEAAPEPPPDPDAGD